MTVAGAAALPAEFLHAVANLRSRAPGVRDAGTYSALDRLVRRPVVRADIRSRGVDNLANVWRTSAPGPVPASTCNVVASATARHSRRSLGIQDVEQSVRPRLTDVPRELWPWSTSATSEV